MRIKPWSITPSVANIDRLRAVLGVLEQLIGEKWNATTQREFQIRLAGEFIFGSCEWNFFNSLPRQEAYMLTAKSKISRDVAERMVASAGAKVVPLRAYQLVAPLITCGFINAFDDQLVITDSGRALLAEDRDYWEICLRFLLKWQIPNPLEKRAYPAGHGYNIKPFGGYLRLLSEVNRLWLSAGMKQDGLSLTETGIFALTLIDWREIEKTAREVIDFRRRLAREPAARRRHFCRTAMQIFRPHFDLRGVDAKAARTLEYFRITGYVNYTGHWRSTQPNYRVGIAPLRSVEVDSLLSRGWKSACPGHDGLV